MAPSYYGCLAHRSCIGESRFRLLNSTEGHTQDRKRMEHFVIRPIGHVENDAEDIGFNDWKALVSRLVIDETYAEALNGIE